MNRKEAGIHELRLLIQRHPQTPEAQQARTKLNAMGVKIVVAAGALRRRFSEPEKREVFVAPTPFAKNAKRMVRPASAIMKKSGSLRVESASRLIDARIQELGDWRGEMLSRLRALIKQADPEVVEEWKWEILCGPTTG